MARRLLSLLGYSMFDDSRNLRRHLLSAEVDAADGRRREATGHQPPASPQSPFDRGTARDCGTNVPEDVEIDYRHVNGDPSALLFTNESPFAVLGLDLNRPGMSGDQRQSYGLPLATPCHLSRGCPRLEGALVLSQARGVAAGVSCG
jgi:hypothetical protein